MFILRYVIIYIQEIQVNMHKTLDIIYELSKVTAYIVNAQDSIIFPYYSNE